MIIISVQLLKTKIILSNLYWKNKGEPDTGLFEPDLKSFVNKIPNTVNNLELKQPYNHKKNSRFHRPVLQNFYNLNFYDSIFDILSIK